MSDIFYLAVMCLPVLWNRTELDEINTRSSNPGHMVTIKLKTKTKTLPQKEKKDYYLHWLFDKN